MVSIENEQEAHIDSILESSQGLVVVLDGQGRIVRLSKGARKVLGYGDTELTGNNIAQLVPSDRRDWMAAISKRVREDGIVEDIFMHWRSKDGRRLITRANMKSVVNYQGQVVGMIISEAPAIRREPKPDMMTPEEAMDLLNISEIANVVTDLSGNVLLFNRGAKTLTNLSPSQIIGTSISRLFIKREVVGEITSRALRDGKVEDYETTIISQPEQKRVSVSLAVIRNPSGAASRFSFVFVDITKRKEMERELEIRAEKLQLINELATRIRSGRSLSEIYSGAVKGLSRIFEFDKMTLVATVQVEENLMQISSLEGDALTWLSKGKQITTSSGPFGRAMKGGKPIIYTPMDLTEFVGDEETVEEFTSAVVIPLFAGSRFLGLLNFISSRSEAFGPRELDVMVPVADHMALAIETSRLLSALMENINIQTTLMETGAILRSIMDIEEVYNTSVGRARELISSGFSALYVQEARALKLVAVGGTVSEQLEKSILSTDEGLLSAFYYESGEQLFISVRENDMAANWERENFGSLIMAKLIGKEGPIGLLILARDEEERPYSPYEMELLNLYANHLSPSIENAQLFADTKESEIFAQEALDLERQTREALDFIIDMFAHDSQNLFQGIRGYLELMGHSELPEETRVFLDKAMRQLMACSYLVYGTSLLFRNIDVGKMRIDRDETLRALNYSIERFTQLYPMIEVQRGEIPVEPDEPSDKLLSELFIHVMRLMTKASETKRVEVDVELEDAQDELRVDFSIQSRSTAHELLKSIDDSGIEIGSVKLLDPFVVRLLREIYDVRITIDGDLSEGAEKGVLRCSLHFGK